MSFEAQRKYRHQNSEVIYSDLDIVTARRDDIEHLERLSAANPRKRMRLCAHRDPGDCVHEMLIVHERETYVRPHSHPGKVESMHVVSGLVDVVVFDDMGAIADVIRMGDYASGLVFYYRVDKPVFHSLLIRTDVLVFHEVTDGPFRPGASHFPGWAPDGQDVIEARRYMDELNKRIQSFLESA